ncbi:S-adenosyl-L-methionine-dependent methyltransferase [Mycena floridula]|nr:S-adenosyl-L-methionine-dependent methyltransferase [Mycena floridula]
MSTQTSHPELTSALYDALVEAEESRLRNLPVERELTLDTILSYLGASGKIADIGGATGIHAFPLAEHGHEVHLRDLSPGLVARAREKHNVAQFPLESIDVGNALDENLFAGEKGAFDVVLLLGPLYHLVSGHERAMAIKNSLALLKPKTGVLFCAFISRLAHLRDLAQREPERLVREGDFYDKYLESGQYVKMSATRGRRVESYHASLEEIRPLVDSVGGKVVEILSVEGILPGGLDKELAKVDQETLNKWIEVLKPLSRKPENLGCADHWLVVVKPHE